MREQHYEDKKLNIDFYEGIPQVRIYECDECDRGLRESQTSATMLPMYMKKSHSIVSIVG